MTDGPTIQLAPLVMASVVLIVGYRFLLRWDAMIAGVCLIIMFIPIRRYSLPAQLPFELEPYRLLVAVLIVAWASSLLIDPRVRIHRTLLDGPILALLAMTLASNLANPSRVSSLGTYVAKSLTFFLSFLLVYYFITSVIRTPAKMLVVLKTLVAAGAVVSIAASVERRTSFNAFDHLSTLMPFLSFSGPAGDTLYAGRLRAFGSAQHPIALGAALVMLIPFAFFLARSTKQARWWVAFTVLNLGALATASRTAILMMVVLVVVAVWLRPTETKRLWPAAIPLALVIHFAVPGAIGTIKNSFFPAGGLISDQSGIVEGNELRATGRIDDIGPALQEFKYTPVLGQGFGTRITGYTNAFNNAPIFDDQWLGNLLEIGLLGTLCWAWIFGRSVRRFGRMAKEDDSDRSLFFAAAAAAVASFAIGMFTFDAFAFIQVTLILFIILGLAAAMEGAAAAKEPREWSAHPKLPTLWSA